MAMARDIMHLGAECINEDETLLAAAQKMRDLDVGSLPICGNDDRLRGIITDRDIVVRCCADGSDPAQVKAGEFAQDQLHLVSATDDADAVVRMMERHQIRRVPVIEDRRLVGMISEADLAQHLPDDQLARFVENVYAPGRNAH
ncbi:CBS domain-containing protein [Actinomadura barringtoniae]|uniref:CBS domain-containing protein n=1 Tax=Actinomadura barringtoniae TaxID=1427535 RepID=A0A939PIW9_9ACTN|nr:CBS domain-containing protein [Actinomadura barringtoniae]MBO2449386.1 CBS domain-containing protein [Actinomadura barringtoniae]